MTAPTHHVAAIDDFLVHIRGIETETFDPTQPDKPRRFVPKHELQRYLNETRIRALLRCYNLPSTDVTAIHRSYSIVFTILVSIHRAEFITHFIRYVHLDDEHLPLPLLSDDGLPHECKPFFDRFRREQWRFCTLHFGVDRLNDTELERERIMPFVHAEPLSHGPDSRTYKVKIHPAYNGLLENVTVSVQTAPRNSLLIDDAQKQDAQEQDAPAMTNVFVLKTCLARQVHLYDDEVHAYKTMRRQSDVSANMLRFYGSWRQGETHHILLEYVDGGTLEDYLKRTTPPTRSEDIFMFWERIFDLVKLLARIHRHEDPGDRHRFLQGIHHDIKPSNILVERKPFATSRFDVTFKLADFGLADFERSGSTRDRTRRRDVNGTQVYSAPECFQDEANHSAPHAIREASPSKDIWSMGCVLSEAAVWSVLLWEGLAEYRRERSDATNQISGLASTAYNGCFHDGWTALPIVFAMHDRVKSERRRNDNVIEHVVPIIEEMLNPEQQRQAAVILYDRFFWRFMREAKAGSISPTSPRDSVPQSLGPYSPTEETRRPPPPELPPDPPQDGLGIVGFSHLHGTPISGMGSGIPRTQSMPPAPSGEKRHRPLSDPGYTVNESREGGKRSVSDRCVHRGSYGTPYASRPNRNELQNLPNDAYPKHHHDQYLGNGTTGPTGLNTKSQAEEHYEQAPEVSHHAAGRPVTQTSSSSKEKLPEATIEEYERWIANSKRPSTTATIPPVGHEYLDRLNGRDQIFLFDDSSSMGVHWKQCKRTFKVLAYLVKDKDPDGIEIRFANNSSKRMKNKNRSPLLHYLENTRPSGLTDISCTLCEILDEYDWSFSQKKGGLALLWNKGKKEREMKWGLDIFVFTDGAWSGGDSCLENVAESIKKLIARGVPPRKIGIQFVQFGNDPEGTQRLEILDNGMQRYGVPKDIIDTERCNGNVFKMLLGGSSKLFDADDSKSSEAPTATG